MAPKKKTKVLDTPQKIKDAMSVRQKIKFLNTPYNELPTILQPGMTRRPQKFNFVRMQHPRIGQQHETFAARLLRYRHKYHLTEQKFCDVCNEYASKFDIKDENGKIRQKTRITLRDLSNYENFNISPKIDKMMVISGATQIPLDYFAGYGELPPEQK